jgi:hypothetical protein
LNALEAKLKGTTGTSKLGEYPVIALYRGSSTPALTCNPRFGIEFPFWLVDMSFVCVFTMIRRAAPTIVAILIAVGLITLTVSVLACGKTGIGNKAF